MSRTSTGPMTGGRQQEGLIRTGQQSPASRTTTNVEKLTDRIRLLIDHSSSMDGDFSEHDPQRRIIAAKTAMVALVSASDRNMTAYGLDLFSSHPYELIPMTNSYDLLRLAHFDTADATHMSSGILYSLRNPEPTRIILLSDGEPTDRVEQVLDAAQQAARLKIPIDTIAIGAADDSLLREIADITGGIFYRADTVQALTEHFVRLEPSNRLLLTHHR